MSRLPVVAVVGRPNVGKSTLVNRIIGRRAAITEEMPGVTRDRKEFEADWTDRRFVLVDTGGWEVTPDQQLTADVRSQAEAAIAAADAVIMVVDVTVGVTDDDDGVAGLLRRSGVPVVLAANKVDGEHREADAASLWSLGLGEPAPVSALHGRGVGDLLDRVVALLPEVPVEGIDRPPALAIVGRPNVGKSTLLNRLLGRQRVLVSPEPGTTRDPIDVEVQLGDERYRVIDTAGMRRPSRVEGGPEYFSVLRAKEVVAEADVALLMIDAIDGVTHHDQRLAEEIASTGAGLIVLLNKWDIADEEERAITEDGVGDRLAFVGWAPVLRMSALTGARTHRLAGAVELVVENRRRRIATGRLNRLIREWQEAHPPPTRKGRRARILYAVQAGIEPPTIVLFVSGGQLGPDYRRFLENRLRDVEDFTGTPIKLATRRRARRVARV